jgi:CMP-N-acetylneuraminic acid synthetase
MVKVDFVIPAKLGSLRVPDKNWREFYGQKCLVEILVDKLRKAGAKNIYVSCEAGERPAAVCQQLGVHHLIRDPELSHNSTPLTEWLCGICAEVPGDNDIAWCQVCDPFFDGYLECLYLWDSVRESEKFDSLVVTYPWRGYLMTDTKQPLGWSFGEHHTPSQKLPTWFTMPFTLSILTRQAIAATRYHVGRNPFWYEASGRHIDIDTPQDFEDAAVLYKHHMEKRESV